ncbi:MAG TPA: dephospho-CoA kinase [Acidimicrobiales bacterium]|nr:dephospho-CoA kinase [Acidimicrobiales bacterium]
MALAGGIGAGKSAVGDYLSSRGFTVVDADQVARFVVEPQQPAYFALQDAFGRAVLTDEQLIDRAFLADVVFHDDSALRRLNAITHGYIGREIVRQLDLATGSAAFVALPLFRPEHRATFVLDEVWAVLSEPEVALGRLKRFRGFNDDDARSRLRAQDSNDHRAAIADVVLWNNGTLDELREAVDTLLRQRGLA